MNITFVGECTSIVKNVEKYRSMVEWRASSEKYSMTQSAWIDMRLELGQKIFVNFTTEDVAFSGLESKNNPENISAPQTIEPLGVMETESKIIDGYYPNKLDRFPSKV